MSILVIQLAGTIAKLRIMEFQLNVLNIHGTSGAQVEFTDVVFDTKSTVK